MLRSGLAELAEPEAVHLSPRRTGRPPKAVLRWNSALPVPESDLYAMGSVIAGGGYRDNTLAWSVTRRNDKSAKLPKCDVSPASLRLLQGAR